MLAVEPSGGGGRAGARPGPRRRRLARRRARPGRDARRPGGRHGRPAGRPRRQRRQRLGHRGRERAVRPGRRSRALFRDGHVVLGGGARRRGPGAARDAPDRERLRAGPRRDRAALLRRHPALGGAFACPLRGARRDDAAAGRAARSFRRRARGASPFSASRRTSERRRRSSRGLAALHRSGVAAGTTSAGRDGEEFDAITGEPKPRFRLWPGQFVASARRPASRPRSPSTRRSRRLPFPTRFGPIKLRRGDGEGAMEVDRPGHGLASWRGPRAALESGRRRDRASGRGVRASRLRLRPRRGRRRAVGRAAAGGSLDESWRRTRGARSSFALPLRPRARTQRMVVGALTDARSPRSLPAARRDARRRRFRVRSFSPPACARAFAERASTLAVRRPARLLAVTTNPTDPSRPPASGGTVLRGGRGARSRASTIWLTSGLGLQPPSGRALALTGGQAANSLPR